MIVDHLQAAERYFALHPGFRPALEYLRRLGEPLKLGKHPLDGDRLLAIVSQDQGRGREQSLLESHRRYIDIQYVLRGVESIGWLPTAACTRVSTPYAPDKDIGFFYDRPPTWIELPAGYFAILFPDDAHAPLAGSGPIAKVVLKIAVEW